MKLFALAATALALVTAAPATAASTYLLTFDRSTSCSSTCSNYGFLEQSVGDAPGVDVSTRSVTGPGNAPQIVNEGAMRFWATGYGDLDTVVWGGQSNEYGVPEMRFVATGSDGITLNSLQAGAYAGVDRQADFRVYDLSYNLLYTTGPILAPGAGHLDIALNVSNAAGLILQFGPNGYNVGIDNLSFTVGPLGSTPPVMPGEPGAVPEPASWAMMLTGIGAVGGSLRRRRAPRRAPAHA